MKTKLLALTIASLFTSSTFAATSVALVDLTTVYQSAPQGSAAFSTLKKSLAPQVKQLQVAQKKLQAESEALRANKKLSHAAFKTKEGQLAKKGRGLQKQIDTFQEAATKKEQTLLKTFGTDVKAAVAQVAKQEHYNIVLSNQSTLYSADDTDITQQVIAILKNQAK